MNSGNSQKMEQRESGPTDSKGQEPEHKGQEPGSGNLLDSNRLDHNLSNKDLLDLLARLICQLTNRDISCETWVGFVKTHPDAGIVLCNGVKSPEFELEPDVVIGPALKVLNRLLGKLNDDEGIFEYLPSDDFHFNEVIDFFGKIFTPDVVNKLDCMAWLSATTPAFSSGKNSAEKKGLEKWHKSTHDILFAIVRALVVYSPHRWNGVTKMTSTMQGMMLLAVVLASTVNAHYKCKAGSKTVQQCCKALLCRMRPAFNRKTTEDILLYLANQADVYVDENRLRFEEEKTNQSSQKERAAAAAKEAAEAAAASAAAAEAEKEAEKKLIVVEQMVGFLKGLSKEQRAKFWELEHLTNPKKSHDENIKAVMLRLGAADSMNEGSAVSGSDSEESTPVPKQKSKRGKPKVCEEKQVTQKSAPESKQVLPHHVDRETERNTGRKNEAGHVDADADADSGSAVSDDRSDPGDEDHEPELKHKSKPRKQEVCEKDNNVLHTAPGAKPDAAAEMETSSDSETEPTGSDDTDVAELPRCKKRKTCGGGNEKP